MELHSICLMSEFTFTLINWGEVENWQNQNESQNNSEKSKAKKAKTVMSSGQKACECQKRKNK